MSVFFGAVSKEITYLRQPELLVLVGIPWFPDPQADHISEPGDAGLDCFGIPPGSCGQMGFRIREPQSGLWVKGYPTWNAKMGPRNKTCGLVV